MFDDFDGTHVDAFYKLASKAAGVVVGIVVGLWLAALVTFAILTAIGAAAWVGGYRG